MWSQTCFHYDHEIPIRQEEIPYECYAMCNFSYIRDETLFYRKKTYFQTRNHFKFIELYSDVFIFQDRKLRDLGKYHRNRKICHILPNHETCGFSNLALQNIYQLADNFYRRTFACNIFCPHHQLRILFLISKHVKTGCVIEV